MAYKVVFTKGPLAGREFALGFTPVRIGRSSDSTARIPDEPEFRDVSKRHFAVKLLRGAAVLENLSQYVRPGPGGAYMQPGGNVRLEPGVEVPLGAGGAFVLEETPADWAAAGVAGAGDAGERPTGEVPTGEVPTGEISADGATGATSVGAAGDLPTGATAMPAIAQGAARDGETSRAGSPRSDRLGGETLRQEWRGTEPAGATGAAAASATSAAAASATNAAAAEDPKTESIADPATTSLPRGEVVRAMDEDKRRRRLRYYAKTCAYGAVFLGLAWAYFFLRPHPEKSLTWPRNAAGADDKRQIVLHIPAGENMLGFDAPVDPRMGTVFSEDGFTCELTTFVGRDRDVPLRLKFVCEDSPENLHKDRETLFEEKRRELEATGGWNFAAVSPPGFWGTGGGGVPRHEIQYTRSEKTGEKNERWFGYLSFAVYGSSTLTFLREIPASEQWRGASFLTSYLMLAFAPDFIDAHWEGSSSCRDDDVDDMLSEADGLLSRNSPMLWSEVEFILQSVLVKSGGKGEAAAKALEKLKSLRGEQRREFNRIFALSHSIGQKAAMAEALRIFSSPGDMRNMLLKKGRWQ